MQVNKWANAFLAIFFFTTLVGGIGLLSTWTPRGPGQAIVNNEPAKKAAPEPAAVPEAREQKPPESVPDPPNPPKELPGLVRQVGEWHRGGPVFVTAIVATSADQLARFFEDKAEAARIAEGVDFQKERLVGFTWMGPSDEKAFFMLIETKGTVASFMRGHGGKNLDVVPNTFLYAVPNEFNCSIEGVTPPKFDVPLIREVELGPFADFEQNKRLADQLRRIGDVRIDNADDLARAFPDEPWATRIAWQVDFAKQRLVVVSWDGRISDQFTATIRDEAIAPWVQFRMIPGATKDERFRFHVYAIARGVTLANEPKPPAKVFVRPFGETTSEVVPGQPLVMHAARGDANTPARQGIFTSAEAVAKVMPKETVDAVIKEVDFKKERLVVFRWQQGSAGDSMTFTVEDADTNPVVVCKFQGGRAKNKQISVFMFIVSNEATLRNAASKSVEPPGWRIDAPNVKAGPRKPLGAPIKIASAADLVKLVPDKDRRESIGFVDFDQSDLLYFAWTGASDDRLTYHIDSGVKDGVERLFVPIRYHPGANKELADHHFFISVDRGAIWRVEGIERKGDAQAKPADRPSAGEIGSPNLGPLNGAPIARRIDLKNVNLANHTNAFASPVKITSANELAQAFLAKAVQERIQKDVDFTKENLLYFAWLGSGSDVLSVTSSSALNDAKVQPVAIFTYAPSPHTSLGYHHHLYAVPKNARITIDGIALKAATP